MKILRLVVFTRFRANGDYLLKLCMLVELEQFLVNFTGKNVSILRLIHMVS